MTPVRSDDSEVYIMIARVVYLKTASICAAQITNLRTNLQIMNTFNYPACELHDLSDIFIANYPEILLSLLMGSFLYPVHQLQIVEK